MVITPREQTLVQQIFHDFFLGSTISVGQTKAKPKTPPNAKDKSNQLLFYE